MMTDDEVWNFYGGIEKPPEAESDVSHKRLKQVANILPGAANSLTKGIVGLYGALNPDAVSPDDIAAATPFPTFDVGPDKPGWIDPILNSVAPEIASWLIPYLGVAKGVKAVASAGEIANLTRGGAMLAEGAGQGVANLVTSAGHPDSHAGAQGAMGFASGLLQEGLPRMARLPWLAGISAANYAATGDKWGSLGNLGFNMLPGAFKPTGLRLNRAWQAVDETIADSTKWDALNTEGIRLGEGPIPPRPEVLPARLPDTSHLRLTDEPNFRLAEPTTIGPDTSDLRLADFHPDEVFNAEAALSSPTGLRLNEGFVSPDLPPEVYVPPSGLNLVGAKLRQHSFEDPLFNLQAEQSVARAPMSEGLPPINHPVEPAQFHLRMDWEPPQSEVKLLGAPKTEAPPAHVAPPETPIAPTPKPSSPVEALRAAHAKLKKESGFDAQNISDVAKEANLPIEEAKTHLVELNKSGDVVLSSGDISLASEAEKAGNIQHQGQDNLLVRFQEKAKPVSKRAKMKDKARAEKHAAGEPYVSRADDFAESGEYTVEVPNGEKTNIFRDPESGWWYRSNAPGEKTTHFSERVAGFTKQEAVDHVMNRVKERAPKVETVDPLPVNDPHSYVPALEMNGKLVPGKRGETHQGIMNRYFEENNIGPDSEERVVHLMSFLDDETHQFMRGTEPVTRDMLKERLGVQDSQGLRDLQGKKAPTKVEKPKPETPKVESTPKDIITAEKLQDVKVLDEAKKTQDLIDKLGHDLKFAKEEGDVIAARGITAEIGKQRMKLKSFGESGQISAETMAAIAGAGIIGLVAYHETKGDMGSTLAAAVIAAGLGLAGAKAIANLKIHAGPEVHLGTTKLPPSAGIKDVLKTFAKETSKTSAGSAVFGRGGLWANSLRLAEAFTGLPKDFRDAKILSDGFIADQLNTLSDAFEKVRGVTPSPAFSEATAKYLQGQLVDQPAIRGALSAGNAKTTEEFARLSLADRRAFPDKWIIMDDLGNTKGDKVQVFHVSNATKQSLLKMQEDALSRMATIPADKEFMKFAMQSRSTMDNLMQVIHAAMGEGEQLNKVLGTMGQYMRRSHKLLTDPKHYPSEPEIKNAMDRLGAIKEDRFIEKHGYDKATIGTVPITHGGKTYHIDSKLKGDWEHLRTDESLKQLVHQYIKEIKQVAAGKKEGILPKDMEQLGTSIFASRKELDAVTEALLGTHKNPLEMIHQTANKLVPSAQAAHFMSDLVGMVDHGTGLNHAYKTEIEFNKAVNDIKAALKTATGKSKTQLESKLQELSAYIPVSGDNPRMGLFRGSYVSRAAHDQLASLNNPMGLLDNSIGQMIGKVNQAIKTTHLTMNPIQHVRNIMQIPMFLAVGHAHLDPGAWKTAYQALKDPSSSVGRRLMQNGVFSASMVHGEFNHGLRELLDGTADQTIFSRLFGKGSGQKTILGSLKKGEFHAAAQQMYAMPDNFVRAAVYLAAESRAAKRLGKAVDHPEVMKEARDFMSRRTMDYSNVPSWVKTGRNIPFVSMFLSYTHEIARIGKNLTQDALKGDYHAGATLAGLGSIPFLLQSYAESQLSEKDRGDWNRAQRLVQDYSRPRFKTPLSRNADGSFNYFDITPLFPFNDFQMAARSIAKGDMSSLAATNPIFGLEKTPIISLLAEQVTGKEIHSGKEFRGPADRALSVAKALLPPHTPGIGYEYTKDVPESMGGSLGVTNLRNARTNSITGAFTRNLLGFDFTQVNPDIATRNFIAAAKRDIANERQYLNDVIKASGVSNAAKERAANRFQDAVRVIVENMQNQLQLVKQE